MLKDRILATIRFFDLQDYPVTLLELHRFLVVDQTRLEEVLDGNWELKETFEQKYITGTDIVLIQKILDSENGVSVETDKGFYCLKGRRSIIDQRLNNYYFSIKREKSIRKFVWFLRHLPFVRGVALGGSQAMGKQGPGSDIDLLVFSEPKFMFLSRMLVTAYFQLLGKRRHGKKVANRFCLNHYLAEGKRIKKFRNLYTAMEYLRLRPLVYPKSLGKFWQSNELWLKEFFPQASLGVGNKELVSEAQRFLEYWLSGKVGGFLEKICRYLQMRKIRQGPFIVASEDELSFHPESKQESLLSLFFKLQHKQ